MLNQTISFPIFILTPLFSSFYSNLSHSQFSSSSYWFLSISSFYPKPFWSQFLFQFLLFPVVISIPSIASFYSNSFYSQLSSQSLPFPIFILIPPISNSYLNFPCFQFSSQWCIDMEVVWHLLDKWRLQWGLTTPSVE